MHCIYFQNLPKANDAFYQQKQQDSVVLYFMLLLELKDCKT